MNPQVAFAAQRLDRARAHDGADGLTVLRWRAALPSPWAPQEVELFVVVPPAYPAQAPSGFDVVGAISLGAANPAGGGQRDVAGERCTHFCWNPQGAINYSAEDGLWRFAKFCESRFLVTQ
jgi:hypothetical protein